MSANSIKILFLWASGSSYMRAAWNALATDASIELTVVLRSERADDNTSFGQFADNGFRCQTVDFANPELEGDLIKLVRKLQPDFVFVSGWGSKVYRDALLALKANAGEIIVCMDTPYSSPFKAILTRVRYRKYLKNAKFAFVAGVQSRKLARWVGIPNERIHEGVYTWDDSLAVRVEQLRTKSDQTNRWLFIGRLIPQKGISLLVDAYREYRKQVADPWELLACGQGPLDNLLESEGITKCGFVPPDKLPHRLAQARCLILPSIKEPWGVVVMEALGCGLPVIASDQCNAATTFVKPGLNGDLFKSGSISELCDCMVRMHNHFENGGEMSSAAKKSVRGWDPQSWLKRVQRIVKSNCKTPVDMAT